MKTISVENAEVTVAGDSGYDFGTQELIANVVFQYDNAPQELDTASGAWWIWPLRQGQLQIQGTLEPGGLPPEAATTLERKTITITANDINGDSQTITVNNAYMVAFTGQIQQLGEAQAALSLGITYQVFLDDDGSTGAWTPPA